MEAILWYLTALLTMGSCGPDDGIVSSHNVGTVFKRHHMPVVFNIDHVDMTLAIPYALKPPVSGTDNRTILLDPMFQAYPGIKEYRDSILEFVDGLDHTLLDLHACADELYADIASMLSDPWQDSQARQKRARVQFLGDVGWGFSA